MKWFYLVALLFSNVSLAATNFCAGKVANSFYCTNDINFQHCTGNSTFVLKACSTPICVTRTPADRNPCVGREAARAADGVSAPVLNNGEVVQPKPPVAVPPAPPIKPVPPVVQPKPPVNGTVCVGGPKFDPAGTKNVGNGAAIQFIGGECLNNQDCKSGCCAGPCGICSGIGAQFLAGKTGCGFNK